MARLQLSPLLLLMSTIGLCSGISLCGCDVAKSDANRFVQTEAADPVSLTVNVTRAAFSENVYERSLSFGTVKPKRSSSLGFARDGRVAKVSFSVGDYIDKGETIAELEQQVLAGQQEEVDNALAAAQSQLNTYQSQNNRQRIARVQQDITRLTAQRDELAVELAKGIVVSPYQALLVESSAEVGGLAATGRPLFRVFEEGPPIIELNLPKEVASRIKSGQELWVRKEDRQIQATVLSKAPLLGASSRTQLLTIDMFGNDEEIDWTYGEVVEVQFWTASENTGFWLPYSALQREANGLWSAYVLDGEGENQAVGRRIVEVVQLEAEHALVRGSLVAGDLYVVDGLNRLVPGQRVLGELVQREFTQPGPPEVGE